MHNDLDMCNTKLNNAKPHAYPFDTECDVCRQVLQVAQWMSHSDGRNGRSDRCRQRLPLDRYSTVRTVRNPSSKMYHKYGTNIIPFVLCVEAHTPETMCIVVSINLVTICLLLSTQASRKGIRKPSGRSPVACHMSTLSFNASHAYR